MTYYQGNQSGQIPGILPGPYYWWEAGAMFGQVYRSSLAGANQTETDMLEADRVLVLYRRHHIQRRRDPSLAVPSGAEQRLHAAESDQGRGQKAHICFLQPTRE